MNHNNKPRWLYRFENFQRALNLLSEAIEIMKERELSPLELEGVIQRFEYCWELAWKTMKDYLEHQGINLETITPSATIKAAFAAKLITDGQKWMTALDTRNLLSHTYDFKIFQSAVQKINNDFLHIFNELQGKLITEYLTINKNHD